MRKRKRRLTEKEARALDRMRLWRKQNADRVHRSRVKWEKKNVPRRREVWREYQRRAKKDPVRRVVMQYRTRMTYALAQMRAGKVASTRKLIGCSERRLRRHLESMFQPGMSWENWGRVWHIDHIIPISAFNLREPRQQRACFQYTNLQPLFKRHNLMKGKKFSLPHE
jgi:hypothetical protein